jgi:thiamine-monophosphate kinase
MPTEFELIDHIFLRRARAARQRTASDPRGARGVTQLGIGDDCALLDLPAGQVLAVSTDMLVSGRHFLPDVAPRKLGHKALAVNLSDLAAMGATPVAFTLSLALPPEIAADVAWLDAFAEGLFALAERHHCELVGGDTTAGPLTISITIFGALPQGVALRRDAAQVGDDIWLSGKLGDARLALGLMREDWPHSALGGGSEVATETLAEVRSAMETPEPRIALGERVRGLAHAAIDLSDGLAGDLAHIARRSGLLAVVDVDAVPRSTRLAACTPEIQRICTLSGGDDYELCFTAPVSARQALEALHGQPAIDGVALTRVGTMRAPDITPDTAASDTTAPQRHADRTDQDNDAARAEGAPSASGRAGQVHWVAHDGTPLSLSLTGFDHFDAA